MAQERDVFVHLLPDLVPAAGLEQGIAVVIDVLRATTTIVHALAAGCPVVRPCADLDEARELANQMRVGRVLLGGERGGVKVPDFDLGNSPREYTSAICQGSTLVFTTTNGTRALARVKNAQRILIGAFVNFSAVCEQLKQDARPIHLVCAGGEGGIAMEDTLLAGAFVDFLSEEMDVTLNDSARLAWDCFENHGQILLGALEISQGGSVLASLGYEDDIKLAAEVDRYPIVPEIRNDPFRIEVGAIGIAPTRWKK